MYRAVGAAAAGCKGPRSNGWTSRRAIWPPGSTFLESRGFRRIGLLGHSLGAVKAIFTLAADDAAEGRGAGRDLAARGCRMRYFCQAPRADEFRARHSPRRKTSIAERTRATNCCWIEFPLPYHVSAAGFVDRYGPEERYNVLRSCWIECACPTLVTYGSSEMQGEHGISRHARGCGEKLADAGQLAASRRDRRRRPYLYRLATMRWRGARSTRRWPRATAAWMSSCWPLASSAFARRLFSQLRVGYFSRYSAAPLPTAPTPSASSRPADAELIPPRGVFMSTLEQASAAELEAAVKRAARAARRPHVRDRAVALSPVDRLPVLARLRQAA